MDTLLLYIHLAVPPGPHVTACFYQISVNGLVTATYLRRCFFPLVISYDIASLSIVVEAASVFVLDGIPSVLDCLGYHASYLTVA